MGSNFSCIVLALLLLTIFVSIGDSHTVVASWSGTITILSDGSIDPVGAPLSKTGNIYRLTNDVQGNIIVQRDDIAIDGGGHLLQGTDKSATGIDLSGRTGVTIWNMTMEVFYYGIYLYSSNQNIVFGCIITNNTEGVYLYESTRNIIFQNVMATNDYDGIYLLSSSNNNILMNDITGNSFDGLFLDSSVGNNIRGNNFTTNSEGVYCQYSTGNTIIHNNFNDNIVQVSTKSTTGIWDNGYPSAGNYWSDYTGTDSNHDGIGDTPYVVDASNSDRYPLMKPWSRIAGDINFDGAVNLQDLVLLANAYGSRPSDVRWNPAADIDHNGYVGLADLVTIGLNYGQHYP